jgi:hypothetical protein
MAGGRPELYSNELAIKICTEIASTTLGLKSLCKLHEDFPSHGTIFKWLAENKEFLDLYTRAKEMQAENIADEMLEIADDGSNDLMTVVKGDSSYEIENKEVTSRSKLRIETRKWISAKLLPKKYGDRIQQDINLKGEVMAVVDWSNEDGK